MGKAGSDGQRVARPGAPTMVILTNRVAPRGVVDRIGVAPGTTHDVRSPRSVDTWILVTREVPTAEGVTVIWRSGIGWSKRISIDGWASVGVASHAAPAALSMKAERG